MSFGKQLQAARSNAGYTQKQLAEILGISKSTITSWETDARQPDIPTIKRLTALLNVTAEELLEIEKASDAAPAESEAIIEERISILTETFAKIGWLDDGGDISDEQFKIVKGVFLMLDEIFNG